MNQILSVEQAKPKRKKEKSSGGNGGPLEIKSVLMIFAIVSIIFGVTMIGSASYSMYKNAQIAKVPVEPNIEINHITDKQVQIKVTHTEELSKVTYTWGDTGEQGTISVNGPNATQNIDIPEDGGELKVYAEDVQGRSCTKTQSFTSAKPIEIKFETSGSSVNIIIDSQTELSYMKYHWDNEEEIPVQLDGLYATEQPVEAPKGMHELTVVVVDINNQQEEKTYKVAVINKPEVEVNSDENGNMVITASDELGIKTVEFSVNGKEYVIKYNEIRPSAEDRKTFRFEYPLNDGENNITVKVYNECAIQDVFREITTTLTK